MKKCNNGAFELGSTTSVHGGWGKCLPNNGLEDIGGNKKRNLRAETMALLQQFVKKDDDQSSGHQLNNEQEADTGTYLTGLAI